MKIINEEKYCLPYNPKNKLCEDCGHPKEEPIHETKYDDNIGFFGSDDQFISTKTYIDNVLSPRVIDMYKRGFSINAALIELDIKKLKRFDTMIGNEVDGYELQKNPTWTEITKDGIAYPTKPAHCLFCRQGCPGCEWCVANPDDCKCGNGICKGCEEEWMKKERKD